MRFPDQVFGFCMSLYHANLDLAHGDDDQRRQLTRKIAEHTCFALGTRWGTKRADPTRPPSKDAIAFNAPFGKLFSFDWQNGATREPNPPGEMEDITGQVFIPVEPVDHLGVDGPVIPVEPTVDLSAVLAKLDAIETRLIALDKKLVSPSYAGLARGTLSLFGTRHSIALTVDLAPARPSA